jgi:hypothetical protein
MSPYKVMVDDNFHYTDEDERSEYGTFLTVEEALGTCRRLVDEALLAQYQDGETAAQLFERYKSFGDDPFVVALDSAPKSELAAPGREGRQNRQSVAECKLVFRKL